MFDDTTHRTAIADHALADARLRPNLGRRTFLTAGTDRPGLIVEPKSIVGIEQFHACLPIRLDRADVDPVAFEWEGHHAILLHHHWDHVLAEVDPLALAAEPLVEGFAVEHIDTHAGECAFIAVLWLLGEFYDPHRLIDGHDPEAVGLFERHLHHANRQVGALAL